MENLEVAGGETLPESETVVPATDELAAEQETPAGEFEEVEHDGKTYKIPRPLKGALLMQADYTRKTQEVAEQRRQHEERVKAFEAGQRSHTEHLSDLARVVAYNDAIAQFEKADWPQIRANNPQLRMISGSSISRPKRAATKPFSRCNRKWRSGTRMRSGNRHAHRGSPRRAGTRHH